MSELELARGLLNETRYIVRIGNNRTWEAHAIYPDGGRSYWVGPMYVTKKPMDMFTTNEHEAADYMLAISDKWEVNRS